MDSLPDEVVLQVLSYLSTRELQRVRYTCRRLRALVPECLAELRDSSDLQNRRSFAGVTALLVASPDRTLEDVHPYMTLQQLTSLTLHADASLVDDELLALAALPRLDHLDVFTRHAAGPALVPVAARLRSLVLNNAVVPLVLRHIAARCRLRAFHMYGNALHYAPHDLDSLLYARSAFLTELTLRCTELSDKHYATIGRCVNLVELRLYSCWMLRLGGALELARLGALRVLHVTGARMLWAGSLGAFLLALSAGVRSLVLSSTWLSDEHCAVLRGRRELRALEAWRTRLTPGGVARLVAALPGLRELDVDVELPVELYPELWQHAALQRLRCRIEDCEEPAGTKVLFPRGDGVTRRGDGEGYSADVFYYWQLQDELLPLHVPWRMPLYVFLFDRRSPGDESVTA